MIKFSFTLLVGSAMALSACGSNKSATANAGNTATNTGMAAATPAPSATGNTAGTATAAAWPATSRIVVEDGVTYRIDASGPRVRLGPNDSRIVTEGGVRYRVDPDGTRVRINPEGLRIGDSVIRGNAPNGRSDVETPGEAALDAGEDAVEAVGDVIPD